MDKGKIIAWIKGLTEKEFVEFFYQVVKNRHLNKGEEAYSQSHLVLGEARRLKEDHSGNWGEWELILLALEDSKEYPKGFDNKADLCQSGYCCGHEILSWAKKAICPLCGKQVYGT